MSWIFGYGSLIFRAGFDFSDRRIGYIRGWTRRFWQESTDHRGTPEYPGRVVTLIRDADAITWGAAYEVRPEDRDAIFAQLDYREKGGYERHLLHVCDDDGVIASDALVYVATPGNPNWGGPMDPRQIAEIVANATGPSGANRDYLLGLRDALREIGQPDAHVEAIANALDEVNR